jgi:hypothetical protein
VDGAGGLYNLVTAFANVVDAARCVESRGMIGRAAEIADGIVLWARPSSYIRDVVVPEITEVRRAAGLDLAGFGPGCRASRCNRRWRPGTEGH